MTPPRRTMREGDEGLHDRTFARGARWLLARGVHPNHFTFLQLPVFILEIVAAVEGAATGAAVWRWVFAFSTVLIIVLDGGDGILARVGRLASKTGAVLDSTFDTLGIAIVMWGAAQFHPEYQAWFMFLFLGNIVLFLQNAILGTKVIAYLRGPVVIGVAIPAVLWGGLVVPSVVIGWMLLVRTPATLRRLAQSVALP